MPRRSLNAVSVSDFFQHAFAVEGPCGFLVSEPRGVLKKLFRGVKERPQPGDVGSGESQGILDTTLKSNSNWNSLSLSLYIYMYICIFTYVYIYKYIYICIYHKICINTYMLDKAKNPPSALKRDPQILGYDFKSRPKSQ